ncbi:Cytochrome P450 [Vigna angularis]|uniref:Cytochrome P450 n=1 Tax=Phaseolus angularis TaxID=3914 RepID=A0A8T0JSD8_PHAAN|nr:Cytochrome P450 [Vigna angularis]
MEFLSFHFLVLLFVLSVYFAREKPHNNKCFRPYPFIGGLLEFLKNRHCFLEWTTQVFNDCPTNTVVMSRPYKFNIVVTANPDNVEHMLKTRFENYPKGERFIHPLHDLLGNGIFNSDSELWKRDERNSLISQINAFHRLQIRTNEHLLTLNSTLAVASEQ